MKTLSDTLLSKFDNAIRQIGPMSMMIDKVVSCVAPTVEAKACSGYGCEPVACYPDYCGSGVSFVIWSMAQQPWECSNPNAGYCGGCDLFGASCG